MKKFVISTIIIVVLILSSSLSFAVIDGSLSLGFKSNSTTGIENVNVALDGRVQRGRVGVKFSHKMDQEQDNETMRDLDIDSMIQATYHNNQWFGGLGIEYERDYGEGLQDKTNIGILFGYESPYKILGLNYNLQGGLYLSTEYTMIDYDRGIIGKGRGEMTAPVIGIVSFKGNGELEFDLDNLHDEDYQFKLSPYLKAMLTDNLFILAGLDYRYDNRPILGPKDEREWSARMGVDF